MRDHVGGFRRLLGGVTPGLGVITQRRTDVCSFNSVRAGGDEDGQEGGGRGDRGDAGAAAAAGGIHGGGGVHGVPASDAAAAGVPVHRGGAGAGGAGALRLGLLAAGRNRRRVRAPWQPAAALPAALRVVLPGRAGGPARVAVVRVRAAAAAAAGGGVPGPARRRG